jgi:hypothetical protein
MPRRNRFVQPNTVRLDLSDGDWVETKERLTYAESQKLYSAFVRSMRDGGADADEMGVDLARFALLRMETWLTDWSFRDDQDKPVPLSRAAIENLDPDTAKEIDVAINAYLTERDAKKVLAAAETGTS